MTTTIEGICKRREIIPRVMPDLIRHPGGEELETTLVVEAASGIIRGDKEMGKTIRWTYSGRVIFQDPRIVTHQVEYGYYSSGIFSPPPHNGIRYHALDPIDYHWRLHVESP